MVAKVDRVYLDFDDTKLHTRPVATGVFFLTRFFHNCLKNDAQDLKKWSRKTRPAFLYNL